MSEEGNTIVAITGPKGQGMTYLSLVGEREVVNLKKRQVILKYPSLFCEYLGSHPLKGPQKIFDVISIDEFQKFLHDNRPRCIDLELLSMENDGIDGFKIIFVDEPENNLNEQDDSSSTLVRPYRKTEIDANDPKKYQREYYRKYRSGKLGNKRGVILGNRDKILEKTQKKTTKTRKSPILTYVKGHVREGRWVEAHWRGGELGEKEAQDPEVIKKLATKSNADDVGVGLHSLFRENLEE